MGLKQSIHNSNSNYHLISYNPLNSCYVDVGYKVELRKFLCLLFSPFRNYQFLYHIRVSRSDLA